MKQRWLFKPPPANELIPTLELDGTTQHELVNLMSIAIESVHRQVSLPQQTKEASNERIAITSQNYSATLQPQSDRLPAAVVAKTSR